LLRPRHKPRIVNIVENESTLHTDGRHGSFKITSPHPPHLLSALLQLMSERVAVQSVAVQRVTSVVFSLSRRRVAAQVSSNERQVHLGARDFPPTHMPLLQVQCHTVRHRVWAAMVDSLQSLYLRFPTAPECYSTALTRIFLDRQR
jgi:hypothetical protein